MTCTCAIGYKKKPMGRYIPPPVSKMSTAPGILLLDGTVRGNICPTCEIGVLSDDFPIIAWIMFFCFFPLGVLCCLAMRQRRCSHCSAVFMV